MSDPNRLLDGAPDELTAKLLRSALDDDPHPRALERTATLLGVAGTIPVVAATAAASTATTATTAITAGSSAASSAAIGSSSGLLVLKWLGIGAIAGLLTAGGAELARNNRSSSRPPPPSPVAAATQTAVPTLAAPMPAPIANEQPKPVTAPAHRPSAPIVSSTALPAPARTPTIAAEIAALDRARSALARHDPNAALAAVDALEESGTAALGPEASVIRAEALFARGDRARAAELARRFIADHPTSPHVARMRAIAQGGAE